MSENCVQSTMIPNMRKILVFRFLSCARPLTRDFTRYFPRAFQQMFFSTQHTYIVQRLFHLIVEHMDPIAQCIA